MLVGLAVPLRRVRVRASPAEVAEPARRQFLKVWGQGAQGRPESRDAAADYGKVDFGDAVTFVSNGLMYHIGE